MEITAKAGQIQQEEAALIVVNLFQGVKTPGGATGAIDKALGGLITDLIASGDLTGKLNELAVLYTRGAIPAQRVMVVGLGKEEEFDLDKVRDVAGTVARKVRQLGVRSYSTIVHGGGKAGLSVKMASQAIAEGTILALYRFLEHKSTSDEGETEIEQLTFVEFDAGKLPQVEAGARVGQVIAESVWLTRDLVNHPPSVATPTMLAQTARQLAEEHGLRCQILDEEQMAELGMGALLGVAQGSQEPARFIILEHNADRKDLDTIVLAGKGLTFDSGGISLKQSKGMEQWKIDMAGGAVVLATLRTAGILNLPLHVVGLVPATENLPSGKAYKPSDVLRSLSGQTIEIISTDAEGRLILADALAYAQRYEPQAVVDLATLTGACVVALGHMASGLMGTDAELVTRLKRASQTTAELAWELPLLKDYYQQIKSEVADVKNSGGRPGGVVTAGAFLSKFAQGYPWAHLDIAGTTWIERDKLYPRRSYLPTPGATGVGVRLLVQFLRDWAQA
ncbi:MAG: leucyl aminopeptidase [Anaerolineales bacterium]|nr:MAG: leucyl aminopeptidase [Anaerolineales bacterium]